jgi:hypothetical protein
MFCNFYSIKQYYYHVGPTLNVNHENNLIACREKIHPVIEDEVKEEVKVEEKVEIISEVKVSYSDVEIYMYVFTNMCVYTCIYVYIFMYTCIYIHVYIYICV